MHKRNIGNAFNTSVNVNKGIILNVKSEQASEQVGLNATTIKTRSHLTSMCEATVTER